MLPTGSNLPTTECYLLAKGTLPSHSVCTAPMIRKLPPPPQRCRRWWTLSLLASLATVSRHWHLSTIPKPLLIKSNTDPTESGQLACPQEPRGPWSTRFCHGHNIFGDPAIGVSFSSKPCCGQPADPHGPTMQCRPEPTGNTQNIDFFAHDYPLYITAVSASIGQDSTPSCGKYT
jgi:hypothetical protein